MGRYGVLLLCLACIADASNCPEIKAFYEGAGCKAISSENSGPCSMKYDCSNVKKAKDDQCFFAGKVYDPKRDTINGTEEYCRFSCYCGEKSNVICAELDCPFDSAGPSCYPVYGHECCPKRYVCDSDKNKITCTYQGNTYSDGESFYPDQCMHCVCSEGFKGKVDQPFCKRTSCLSDEKYYKAIVDKCAPVYIKGRCCPVTFACADGKEAIAANTKSNPSEGATCEFGTHILQIGDKVELQSPVKSTCECTTPPLLTCTSAVDYNVIANL